MAKDAIFEDMFLSLSPDKNKICFASSAQITAFVRKHREWLGTGGHATFFPFKSYNNYFVAHVRVGSDGKLLVGVTQFEYSDVWHAEYRPHVVGPQLA